MKKTKTITKHNWFINLIKSIIRIVREKPEVIQKNDEIPTKAVYIANHSGAAGPLTLSVYFPKILVPWGAYPMTRNYISRWKYLYFIFYRQKIGYSKFRSFILATLFGIISKVLYNGVKLIPTYPDARLKSTIRKTIENLDCNNSILIFPEDSSLGYHEEIVSFHAGFVFLAKQYYQEKGEHIPIIPLFYDKEKQRIIVGDSYTLAEFDKSKKRDEIAEEFRTILNNLSQE